MHRIYALLGTNINFIKMRYRSSNMRKWLTTKTVLLCVALFSFCLHPLKGFSQAGDNTVDALVEMGFENVGWTEDGRERVYVLQNSAYRLNGVGIGKAVDVIQKMGLPENKPCRIIVLDNNIPQISLYYKPIIGDSVPEASRQDWNVSYDLGESWKEARKVKGKNSSLFKVDILVYPQLYYKNLVISQIYRACLEISPAVEISLWKGAKLTAQVIFPAYNDGYNGAMENIRWGYLTLDQSVRLPHNVWLKTVVGVFDTNCYGAEVSAFRPFKDERFSLEGKFGLVGIGYFNGFAPFRYNGEIRWYWSVGGNFYWPQYNTEFKVRAEQYLLKDIGVKMEMIRYFRYAAVGFYAEKSNKARANGGFRISIALPPYRQKRHGYFPRVSTGFGTGTTYNAGNERKYYLMPYTRADDNILKKNQYNPHFIKSELLN